MFTGLIECVGTIQASAQTAEGILLTINAPDIIDDIVIGDSIAVNGICLTATGLRATSFTADVSRETVQRSAAATFALNSKVNLERAMSANGRFGGHIVSGHIDGCGEIAAIAPDGNSILFDIRLPEALQKWTVEKGSIAVNGISLTIASILEDGVRIAVIPHSLSETTLNDTIRGDEVNIECDLFAKYIQKYVARYTGNTTSTKEETLDVAFLQENGFM